MTDNEMIMLGVAAFALWYLVLRKPAEVSPVAPGFTIFTPPLNGFGETSIAGSQSGYLDNSRHVDSGQGTSWNGDQANFSGTGPEQPYVAPLQPASSPAPVYPPPAPGAPGVTTSPFAPAPTTSPLPLVPPTTTSTGIAARAGKFYG